MIDLPSWWSNPILFRPTLLFVTVSDRLKLASFSYFVTQSRSLYELPVPVGWWEKEKMVEDMVKQIKGFVDVLILRSGYQSSGLQAHWDIHNIKKVLQRSSFFENESSVLHQLLSKTEEKSYTISSFNFLK